MSDMQGIVQNIVISRDKSIYVPEIIKKSIVQRDHNVDRLTFDCPRYWNGIDISKLNIYVNYIAAGHKKQGKEPESFLCENVVADEDNPDIFHFDWRITSNVSGFPDKLIFLVCAKSVDAEGNEDVHWNSRLCTSLEVQEGLEASDSIVNKYPDVIEQILSKMGKQIEFRNSGKAIQYRNAGENIWVDLVQLEDIKGDAAVIIESNFKGSDTTANILTKTGETGDKWYSTDEGVYYMINSFGDWINCGSGENLKKIEDEIDALKGDLNELKEQGIGGGSGIPQAQKTNLAKAIRQELAFASTSHPFIDAFLAWLESGSDTPVTPPEDEPTAPTLTGITVTWSAESADVGTDPKTLITSVKAVYSDGSQQTATGYSVTPSALVEGDNNVVVSYGGMSETKSITGIVPEVDVIVYRPAEDCPYGWNVVTIDGDTDISIPIFNNNPSGENGVTFAEFNITDICSYGNTSVNNIKMPSQFTFNNNLNDVNLKGVSNLCCAVFWQNKRYLQFGLSSSDCGTTVESIKQYLARYNYVFYVR